MKRRCSSCGEGEARSITHPAKREIDGTVFAADAPASRCDTCREMLISGPGMLAFDRALTGELARSGTVGPQGFRWLRKAARLPSVRLAELLDVTPGTVSRWENGKQALDRRAVALVSALALDAQGGRAAVLDLLEALAAGKKPSMRVAFAGATKTGRPALSR
jgi:DNA-binding transcriptional regulator YiaG